MDKYKQLIAEISKMLKTLGFKKTKEMFTYTIDNNIGIIDFQKSQQSTSVKFLFTINLGVYLGALKMFDMPYMGPLPTISDCHWRQRIGFLMPENKDHWWEINDQTIIIDLVLEIIKLLIDIAIPKIKCNLTDDRIEKAWMNGISSGLTEQQMYLYLIALMKTNAREGIDEKVDELRNFSKGKPFEKNVRENLLKLGIQL